jgi:membrane protein YdbS with pleckstrin-like domain
MGVMAVPFSNEPLPVEQLPRLHDEAFVSVDPRYMWGRLAGLVVGAAIVVAIVVLVVWQRDVVAVPAIVGGGVLLIVVAAGVVSVLESRRVAYQVREHDLSLRRGVIRHVVETIPYTRVQHVNVGRGVIERWFGLATLEISSAGPDISVPGLAVDDADRIKQVIARRAGVDDEAETPSPVPVSWPPPPPTPTPTPTSPASPIEP